MTKFFMVNSVSVGHLHQNKIKAIYEEKYEDYFMFNFQKRFFTKT